MSKKLYRIPVEWTVTGVMLVEADSVEEAIQEADNMPLPIAEDYVEGSFAVVQEFISSHNNDLNENDQKFLGEF